MNLKVRFKNPVFIAQLILAILTPILAYAGLTVQDLTSWQALGEILLGAMYGMLLMTQPQLVLQTVHKL